MKKSFLIFIFIFSFQSNVFAKENCKDLPGFKKLGKGSIEYTKCVAKKGKDLGKKGLEKLKQNLKQNIGMKQQILVENKKENFSLGKDQHFFKVKIEEGLREGNIISCIYTGIENDMLLAKRA